MKKVLAVILSVLAACCAVFAIGCGGNNSGSELLFPTKNFVECGTVNTIDGEEAERTYARFSVSVLNESGKNAEFSVSDFTVKVVRNGATVFEKKGEAFCKQLSSSSVIINGVSVKKVTLTTAQTITVEPNSTTAELLEIIVFDEQVEKTDEISFFYKGNKI